MIILETETKIRRLYHIGKKSIKEIARTLGISRNTIRRIVRQELAGAVYERSEQPASKLGGYKNQLEAWLLEDCKLPKNQRRNVNSMNTCNHKAILAPMIASNAS